MMRNKKDEKLEEIEKENEKEKDNDNEKVEKGKPEEGPGRRGYRGGKEEGEKERIFDLN